MALLAVVSSLFAFAASSANAVAAGAGTVKIDGAEVDSGNDNGPHQACNLVVQFFGFGLLPNPHVATVAFTAQAPSGVGAVPSTPDDDGSPVGDNYSFTGLALNAQEGQVIYNLDTTLLNLSPQGYHVRVDVTVDGIAGKSKVFFAQPCSPALTVDKTNNANGLLGFNDSEEASAPGQDVTFQAVITNASTVSVTITSVADEVGAVAVPGFTTCDKVPGGGSVVGTVLAASNAGTTDEVTCQFTISNYSPAYGGTKTNTLKVNGSAAGVAAPEATNTSVVTTQAARPDVVVGKSGPASAVQGSTLNSYILTASNAATATGPTGAFTMTDTLPAGETATAVSQAVGGVAWTSCAISGGGSTVTCLHPGLAIGASASQVTVTVTIGAGVAAGTVLRDTVSVPTLAGESVTGNNSAFVDTTVNPVDLCTNIAGVQATVPVGYTVVGTTCTAPVVIIPVTSPDLSIVKAGPTSAVKPGDNVPYTLTVTNIGTGSASNVQVTDTLPAAMTFVSASGSGFTCSGTSSIACQLAGSLAPGGSAVVNVVATLSSTYGSTTIANTAVVLPTDSNPGNNTDTESTAVTLPVAPVDDDLALSKSGLEPSVAPGGVLSWSLTVTNVKGTPAAGFTVTDVVPAGLTVLTVGGTDYGCSVAGHTVTCTYTGVPLPAGSSAAFQIDAVVAADYAGTEVSNTAVVDPGGVDTTNDSATSVTPVTQVITGGGGGGVTEPTPAEPAPAEGGGGPVLPFTGSYTDKALSAGVTFLMLGLLIAITGRRRRSA